jgi:hypothetical protein
MMCGSRHGNIPYVSRDTGSSAKVTKRTTGWDGSFLPEIQIFFVPEPEPETEPEPEDDDPGDGKWTPGL